MIHANRILKLACGLGLLLALVGAPALAQEVEERRRDAGERHQRGIEHREQMQERIRARFSSMLRDELSLSDEQAESVLPAMQELEKLKRERGHERRELTESLKTGLAEGASDAELEQMLGQLEAIDDDLRHAEKLAMDGIDAELNVRQQVKLRFFVHDFRNKLRSRMGRGPDRMERRRPEGR